MEEQVFTHAVFFTSKENVQQMSEHTPSTVYPDRRKSHKTEKEK